MSTRTTQGRQATPTSQGRLVREYRRKNGLTLEDLCNQMRERIEWAPSPASVLNLEQGYVKTPRYKAQQAYGAILGQDPIVLWPEA